MEKFNMKWCAKPVVYARPHSKSSTLRASHSICTQKLMVTLFRPVLCVLLTLSFMVTLIGCSEPQHDTLSSEEHSNEPQVATPIDEKNAIDSDVSTTDTKTTDNNHTAHAIDWTALDTGVTPVDTDHFDYPFAVDSKPVQSYADMFDITPNAARHSLTVGTASNEPLPELLSQLGNDYLSHELVDGENVRLVVYTRPNVTPSQFDYVFADDFARGLTLPIKVQPIEAQHSE